MRTAQEIMNISGASDSEFKIAVLLANDSHDFSDDELKCYYSNSVIVKALNLIDEEMAKFRLNYK